MSSERWEVKTTDGPCSASSTRVAVAHRISEVLSAPMSAPERAASILYDRTIDRESSTGMVSFCVVSGQMHAYHVLPAP